MTPEEINNLSDIEFIPILKACLLRLQNDERQYGNVIDVQHDGVNLSSIVLTEINSDKGENIYFDFRGNLEVKSRYIEVGSVI